ncbi:hypothetical protein [Picosynechococcus sp. NKBG15041c]|uniref:hypothetical protein n=1 Tax=Picosynechococcus sp. NKBG15041c TaxID=1407650 RepID=UPI000465FCB6|nr:hypothetical protein [Picosynechococcus sp. NKBG15041c]
MNLKIKPIVNGLFEATLTHEDFQVTAIGSGKNEATLKAIKRLQQEIEIAYDTRMSEIENEDYLLDEEEEEEEFYDERFLEDEIWQNLDQEIQELALKIAQFTFKAALGCAIRGSIGGSMGGLFF